MKRLRALLDTTWGLAIVGIGGALVGAAAGLYLMVFGVNQAVQFFGLALILVNGWVITQMGGRQYRYWMETRRDEEER